MLRTGIREAAQLCRIEMQLRFHQERFLRADSSGCDEWKSTRDEQHRKSVQPDHPGNRVGASIHGPCPRIYFIFGKQERDAYTFMEIAAGIVGAYGLDCGTRWCKHQ
jgi:hypothetical protein